jgi:peptidoglycan/LPS O-acetylase OafA/YrhL
MPCNRGAKQSKIALSEWFETEDTILMEVAAATSPAVDKITKPFRRDIEGLRAVAVIGVVAYHFGLRGIPGGFVGVDIFFVISGYLITGLLLQELDKDGKIDLARFYGRRARRLLPAALLMTLATLAAIPFIIAPTEQLRFAASAAATSIYASNFLYLRQALDYFAAESASNPFLHTWSLGVEEQFYLIWPALMLFTCRRQVRPAKLLLTLGSLTIVSFALCVWLTNWDQPWAFYASPARAWEFGVGALAALPWVTDWARRTKWLPALGWVAAAALLLSFVLIEEALSFPGFVALLPVAATMCVLIAGADHRERGPARILRTAPFQWVGRRSYAIYLWHWPIVTFAITLFTPLSVGGRLACATLTLLCSAASYRWVEDPIRTSPWLAARATRSIRLGASLTAIGLVASLAVAAIGWRLASTPRQKFITRSTHRGSLAGEKGCLAQFKQSEPVVCTFGATSSSTTVVLIGDSHAAQWSTPLARIAKAEKWRLVTYLKAGCAVADVSVYSTHLHRISDECAAWRKKAIAAIVRLRPNMIVASEFSNQYFLGPRFNRHDQTVSSESWIEGITRSLTELRTSGSPIALLRDTPIPRKDMRICLENAERRGNLHTCDIPRPLALDPTITLAESKVATSIPGVHFVDLTSHFCDDATCPAWRDGMIVYKDGSHIASAFSASLAGPLRDELLGVIKH